VINLYDLMDSAYDAPEIKAKSLALGHVPIIDPAPEAPRKLHELSTPEPFPVCVSDSTATADDEYKIVGMIDFIR
jgi:hypothetical protein